MVSVVTCCSCALMLAVLPEPRKIGLGPGASADSPVGVFRVDVRPGETLVSVRDRVRALPESVRTGGIEVVFPSGDLELEGTLELESSDGGLSPAAPVVWRAEKPGGVRLTTSHRIPVGRFAKVTDPAVLRRLPPDVRGRVLVADVGDFLKTGDAASAEVFVNGDFATCARWPNGGEYTSFTGRVDSGTCKGVLYERGAFVYPNPRAKRWDFAKGVRFFGYWTHDWHGEEATAHFYGTENGTNDVIRLSTPVFYGVNSGTWGRPERRFYAWDLPEELDMPREWWIDREKRRLYILPENGSFGPDDRICLAVKSPPIIRAKGLRNFVFRGLVFEHHNGEAMVLSQADGVSVQGCGFSCVCGDAKIYRSAALALDGVRCRVSDCRMRHLGAGGIRLDGGDRRGLVRSDTVVERCEIIDFGVRRRTYHGAVEAEGCGHVIRHNEFAYAPHHAMRYETNDSVIEYNDIHHVLLETGDAGAIYTGRDCTTQGNVVRYNFIHELGSEGVDDSTMGLYFDDCDCGDEVYGNVFWKCSRGILLGGGRDHPIRGNVFADCSVGLSIDMRGKTWGCFYRRKKGGEDSYQPDRMDRMRVTEEPWKSRYPHLANQLNDLPEVPLYDPVEGNVFLNCGKSLVQLAGEELTPYLPRMTFASNLVYVSSGRETAKPDERIRGGFVICGEEDPGFVDAAKGDFRLKRDASVLRHLPAFDARRFNWPAPWDAPPSVTGGIRGYSLDISRGKVPKMETLYRIVDILAALKYNFFTLYCEHAFAYSKHPVVWEEVSPMTPEQVRALDDYCHARGIELGPNQQTFGHMEKWLKHPEYNDLAETPQGGTELDAWWEPGGKWVSENPTCLCPTDPRSVEFVAGLLDELLPCYRSRFVNIHCDETHELYDTRRPMPGRSAAEIAKKGATAVYLDYFDKVNALCAARGCTIGYAADVILKHPEVVGRLPKNAICGIWQYEADAADYFMKNTPIIKATGVRYSLCCSTSCWLSLFGRTANMMKNVDYLCEAFEKYGAFGVSISDWGDGGHPQPWLASVPALVYFSHRICGEKMSREQLAAAVDGLLGCKVGASLLAYGDLTAKIGGRMNGGSELYWILADGKDWRPNVGVSDPKRFVTERSKEEMLEYGRYAKTLADLTGAPEWVKDDFALIDLLFRAVEMRMKEPGKRNFKACFEPEYRRLWRKSNRVGGLSESVNVVFGQP